MNCLQIVQEACKRIGITSPNAAVTSTDLQVQQVTALLNEEGQALTARYRWQAVTKQATFTSLAAQSQGTLVGGSILTAADNLGYIVNATMWNRTTRQPVIGPNAPAQWQQKLAMTFTGPVSEYRLLGGILYFNPAPAAGNTIAFEYATKNWLANAAGDEFRDTAEDDEDTPLLDWQIILMGLKWRWKQAKGFDYAEDFNSYERRVADAIARDGTKPMLNLSGDRGGSIDPIVVVPSGSWPVVWPVP